ncbi:MAG: T9SS type A sorting domain-containing protein [Saprospiraceae bacterium]|nr:T9SS type A sorting domain-containing protein [Candidatus Defluviibacterium haderslevense]
MYTVARIIAISVFIGINTLFAQLHDANWIIGFGGNHIFGNRASGLIDLQFVNSMEMHYPLKDNPICNPGYCPSAISNAKGELLFYSDAFHIYNRNHEIVKGGDHINPGYFWNAYEGGFYPIQNGALFLPWPNHEKYYFNFHKSLAILKDDHERISPVGSDKFYYTLLDLTGDNGMGEAIKKNVILLEGEINTANMSACKHANGRDWWLIQKTSGHNEYFFFLLDPSGLLLHHKQFIGPQGVKFDGNGRDCFSDQGDKYVQVNHEDHIILMDFDRCKGELSNPLQIINPVAKQDSQISVCTAFSSSGRYLYFCNITKIWQYDLNAKDISQSVIQIANYDGFKYDEFWPTTFYNMRLAPDGMIYICPFGGNNAFLHRINYPDRKGLKCEVIQHAVRLPAEIAGSLPVMPNYRLGPLIGISCDSIYDINSNAKFNVFPNPVVDYLYITTNISQLFKLSLNIQVFDLSGKEVLEFSFTNQEQMIKIPISHLAQGMYVYKIISNEADLGFGKFIKI